jgi:hypothetical protein
MQALIPFRTYGSVGSSLGPWNTPVHLIQEIEATQALRSIVIEVLPPCTGLSLRKRISLALLHLSCVFKLRIACKICAFLAHLCTFLFLLSLALLSMLTFLARPLWVVVINFATIGPCWTAPATSNLGG